MIYLVQRNPLSCRRIVKVDLKLLFPIPSITKKDAISLIGLVQKREYKPVIDRAYQVDQIVETYKYVESGQKIGNVVIKIFYK